MTCPRRSPGCARCFVQALHPLAMAGVDQHSDWRADPAGRLASTSAYLVTITYGDRAAADRAAARVRKIHERVRGTDPLTGRPYEAGDPALLLLGPRGAGGLRARVRRPVRDAAQRRATGTATWPR